MVHINKKKGLVYSQVAVIVVLLFLAAIVSISFIPRIIKPSNVLTDLVEIKSLDEENMFAYIKALINQQEYDSASQLIEEYYTRYDQPYNENMHQIIYMKFAILLNTNKYDEALDYVILYNKSYPEEIGSFEKGVNHVTQTFFALLNLYSTENDGINELYNGYFLQSKLGQNNNLSGNLHWPKMPEKIEDYPIQPINPLFFHWYNHIKLNTSEGKNCNQDFINKQFSEIFVCYNNSGESNNHICNNIRYYEVINFFNVVNNFCKNQFITAVVDNINTILNNSLNGNRHVDPDSYLDITKLMELNPGLFDGKSTYHISIYEDSFLDLFYNGILFLDDANNALKNKCTHNDQIEALFHLFNLDGNISKFKESLETTNNRAQRLFSRNNYLGNCIDDKIKLNYEQAYLLFKGAYNMVNDSDEKDKIEIYDLVNNEWKNRSINDDEIKKAKALIYLYYLQASLVNDAFNNNYFSNTISLSEEIINDCCFNKKYSSLQTLPFSYGYSNQEGFNKYFKNMIGYNLLGEYICTTKKSSFDFKKNNYFVCFKFPSSQAFSINIMQSKMKQKINGN
jgi:hypothetical protein